ncbi:MAG: ATP-dependent DNA helicase RecG [Anaerococcus sp.]|nr:ATP-dependent DNA helicase RecG [Anaerococcus sp.]
MDLNVVKGIGPKKKNLLRKLGINSVSDLYNYYPRAYEDRSKLRKIKDINNNKDHYFIWKIRSKLYIKNTRKMTISYLYASEEGSSEKIRLIWFYDRYSPRKLRIGKEYKFFTKISRNGGYVEAKNPLFSEMTDDQIGSIVSIYPLTSGLSNNQLHNYINESLKYYDKKEDFLAEDLVKKYGLDFRYNNLFEIHNPRSIGSLMKAKSSVKIMDLVKDLVFLQVIKNKTRQKNNIRLKYKLSEILNKLDFTLTKSQARSLYEILSDCQSEYTANRLLIGDVGSGKTIIAMIMMIIFAQNSYQSAMMVPTEVLAIQHFEKNLSLFNEFGIRLGLLTGSSKDKDLIKKDLLEGKIQVLIGTHALIQEDVEFKNLKFVVNDEQHRFGVSQRQMLALKGKAVNYLTMTATPIPRTMYLKISNILDMSMIDELPRGRKPIETQVISEDHQEILFDKIEENIKDRRQVYVVTNNIDGDDKNSLLNLFKKFEKRFNKNKISMLHGKMKAYDKERILKDFSIGKIDILISTTVIEVGIDVPNANMMVIYNASNFGLSTLHQLRGRVGRGPYKSFCYLISKDTKPSNKLNILVKESSGFEIAKKDFDLRGGGKIISLLQHGKNLSKIEFLNMDKSDIDQSFKIYNDLKENDFRSCDLSFITKFFGEDRRIILN